MKYVFTGPTQVQTHWDAESKLYRAIMALTNVTEITTGGAYGIDTLAAMMCFDHFGVGVWHRLCVPKGKWYNHQVLDFPFNEIEYVEGGYMKRNDRLVNHCDVLLAFPESEEEQLRSGTWATVRRARKAGKEVRIYPLT